MSICSFTKKRIAAFRSKYFAAILASAVLTFDGASALAFPFSLTQQGVIGPKISTFAGVLWSTVGVGGAATSAQLAYPMGVALDSSGNLYIADAGNAVVRKVTAATGVITNIAGNGVETYTGEGDGGAAANAQISCLQGIAVDGSGNVYISDGCRNVVRKSAAATGIITTVAGTGDYQFSGDGGPATSASLADPWGLACDSSGNLYIADTGNGIIRKLIVATGLISTVAGTGAPGLGGNNGPATSAGMVGPFGVAVDAANNIFIAEYYRGFVRKVTAATGIISIIAGTGIPGFSGDGGAATAAKIHSPSAIAVGSGGNVYFADQFNNVVRKVTVATGIISTVAGSTTAGYAGDGGLATSAKINSPRGVAVGRSGDIYIADYANDAIRKVASSTGNISTVAGNGTMGYIGDGAAAKNAVFIAGNIATDSSGNIFLADYVNNVVRKVTKSTGIISTVAGTGASGFAGDGGVATSAKLTAPQGLALDSAGNIYISGDNRVRKVTASTGVISSIVGTGTPGHTGDGGAATSATIFGALGLALDSHGNLFIADSANHVIRKLTVATGILTTIAGDGTSNYSGDGGAAGAAAVGYPVDLAVDASDDIYIADSWNSVIRKITVSTGLISTVVGSETSGYSGDGGPATNAEINQPRAIAFDASGNMYFDDNGNAVIRKVAPSTGIISTVGGNGTNGYTTDGVVASSARLSQPVGLAIGSDGSLYISEAGTNLVRKVK